MKHALLALLCIGFAPVGAYALPILADISSHRVEIHSAFTGTQLLVFGARNDPGDVVVVVRGPEKNITLRKKERVAGIWINRHEYRLPSTPLYYRIASSKPLEQVRQYQMLGALDISAPVILQPEGGEPTPPQALQKLLWQQRLHSDKLGTIDFMGPTLFKASFDFPDNMPRGIYTAEAYLFSDGSLAGMHAIPVEVYKVGFDAFVYEAAQRHSLLYGIIAVAAALSIGGAASWIFRRI